MINQLTSGIELWKWRNSAITTALGKGVSPREVDWLLQEIAGLDKLTLRLESFKHYQEMTMVLSLAELDSLWQKRLQQRVPIQYLAGRTPWRKFTLAVSDAVLIPRPETEILIDLVMEAANQDLQSGIWVDLGTGSGAIALGLAEVLTNAKIYATDISEQALAVARTNTRNLGFTQRVEFHQGCWWEPLNHLQGKISGMVSNPPYIPSDMIGTLEPEVVKHEPHLALDGGVDGLEAIRYLVEVSPHYLLPGGVWLIEMMAGQDEAVREMLINNGNYSHISIHTDLAGIKRFALAHLSS
ncbi:peptide chain release factor N(5)-glutamine methyltransferase [Cylindrospermopsis raciborskii]|uniref:peptide chain release factor N(5)-glutamine methyltransferase n=1 Tax=Cylindrospermopsis raciborskii TaxID=77022 RepID=UPI0038799EF5